LGVSFEIAFLPQTGHYDFKTLNSTVTPKLYHHSEKGSYAVTRDLLRNYTHKFYHYAVSFKIQLTVKQKSERK